MNYKDTLLMPKTDFEMRANLPTKEYKFQSRWLEQKVYEKMLENRKDAKPFILHDGPPYANGDIHIGHALNKILKDFIVRSKYMEGYKVPFVPGWDTHGLPIETAVQKLGHNRKELSTDAFRKICLEYAQEQVKRQKEMFYRLGVVGDYDNPYITYQKEFEANQIDVFGKMAVDGLIYKGFKPVYWSPSSESALAEAEIEYHEKKSPSIYVRFKVSDGKGILDEDAYFIIWTTTPWTIPANLGICLNESLEYALVESETGKYVVLKELVDSLWETFGFENKNILKIFKGKELEYIKAKHPLYERESLVILGDHVSSEAGTGCVHTAPGHGVDDFIVGQKYGLEAYCPVDEKGYLTQAAGEFVAGQFVDDANKTIVTKLDEEKALLKLQFIKHSYPHDWRTKKPIIFRATAQWFASIDKIRGKLLSEVEKIDWIPKWGEKRMYNMVRDRGDWCISRQRLWGVPIPIIYSEDNEAIIDKDLFKHFSNLFREHGSNIWYEKDVMELLPQGYTHPKSPNNIFRKELDTMDVWFDSGSSHTGVLVERGLSYPADLYLEGSDQYRGWFNSSLTIGVAVHNQSPYKQVLSHGFVMDGKGIAMSKSLGNTVSPKEIFEKQGADVLRLWVATTDYQADGRIGDEIIKQASESYRKIRNTFRFMLGNINPEDFTENDLVDVETLPLVDKHMLVRLEEVVKESRKAYANYEFTSLMSILLNFMTTDISAYYLDFTKDILYIEKKDSIRRRQVQTVLYYLFDRLLRVVAPILVHTAEELNDFIKIEQESIHLSEFKDAPHLENQEEILDSMNKIFELRAVVYKELENARENKTIGKSLEASVRIELPSQLKELIEKEFVRFNQFLIVSKAELVEADELKVTVEKCLGHVCPRCWNITDAAENELCDRCKEALN